MFVPRDEYDVLFEQLPGGGKTCFAYALCLECSTLDDKSQRILEALRATWGRGCDD